MPGGVARGSELEDIYRRMPEMRRPKPSPEQLATALEAFQRMAADADAEDAADGLDQELPGDAAVLICSVCGHRNRPETKFCSMCGVAVQAKADSGSRLPEGDRQSPPALARSSNPMMRDADVERHAN